jgi:hypothetical protein
LLLDALGQRARLIDLVDRDDDGNFGGVRVVDGFDVCGMTPSSAAVTSTTMSVAFAPRERMRVNAS